MNPSGRSTAARNYKSTPCRFYNQGHCRFGEKCKFSHDSTDVQRPCDATSNPQPAGKETRSDQHQSRDPGSESADPAPSGVPSSDASDARPRPKRGEIPCRTWKAGTCTKGSRCWFSHDIDIHKQESDKQKAAASRPAPLVVEESPSAACPSRVDRGLVEAARIRAQEAEAAARERANAIFKEEAAKTTSQLVFGSLVTFSAGLDVPHLITGFETCTLRVGNLPLDVKEDDIHELLRRQDLNVNHLHILLKKTSDRRQEAHIITGIAAGRALASSLDGIEFQEETLAVEMSAANSLEGMSAGTGQSSEILTISWRAPSTRYVAEYADIAAANAKVKELDRLVYSGRRIKVEMNSHPRGRPVPNLRLNAIKINNLPFSVTDQDVMEFTGSASVKRLPVGGIFGFMYPVEQIVRLVRDDIERAVPGGLKKFDDPSGTCNMEGVVSARAQFSSWDEAHVAYTRLSDKRYGTQPVWLRLPDPMYFTLVIPVEQYKAQKAQWDELLGSIKDRKACSLNVRETGRVVHIRLSGSVKEATGALKVRVENLAKGVKLEGWHRSLGITGNSFVTRVHSETGAYLRTDWKQQSLRVFGTSRAVDHAREMIKRELDRLASLDYTVTLARRSVGFFVREGIQQLKETLGENNVRFAMSSRKITVSGGEEARHTLDRLIARSFTGDSGLPNASQGSQTCPVCYDSVSSPHHLGCGHTYCVACLRHYTLSALDSDQLPLTCLGDEAQCRVPIPIPTIQQFLPLTSFNRLLEVAFDAYIAKHPEEFKHCKTPDCTQIYRTAQAGAIPGTLHCPSCFSAVCNGCHEDGHEGMSCAESKTRRDPAEQERLTDAWITSQGGRVKKCPRCNIPIEKLEGCNHMTCQCGAHICWRCMGVFTRETIYEHMHTSHGTIHDDLPVAHALPVFLGGPVDIQEQRALLRQAEERRAAALLRANGVRPWHHDAAGPGGDDDYLGPAQQARERWREEEEERVARLIRLQRQRVVEERERQERRAREQQRVLREAEGQAAGGWGCMIM